MIRLSFHDARGRMSEFLFVCGLCYLGRFFTMCRLGLYR
jgi:hypothetical protein